MKTKLTLILMSFLLIAGCGHLDRKIAGLMGHASICVDGVSYLQFTSGSSVAYNKDGTVKLC